MYIPDSYSNLHSRDDLLYTSLQRNPRRDDRYRTTKGRDHIRSEMCEEVAEVNVP